ncbi:DUF924 family protein [Nitratireductor sp. ZSWI3]|uniref:DUF924 family protein n=1 Tax=Nitratireductor sp. ZSWI3 TaxID=2966359 RepID=UPI00214FD632|nr:DUF924 family protein [Nitratireductor sp. ZSWI3]MCR4268484.1 DUF924 domain-containing protein [Nitratireductor sp. ZSWI3]
MSGAWQEDVLKFWFGELTPQDWFEPNNATDAAILDRFLPLHERLKQELPQAALSDPRAALAAILVFDQFPRNMFRRQAAAFATDELAMRVASNAVEKGLDEGMTEAERQFLYMPYMHSEVLADQERAVMLFKGLGNEDALKYAIEHRDIVARFGRFPHRNRVLGRTSSEEEQAFLEGHAGYGQ